MALPTCQRHGLGVMVYAPLAGGWLTGKYQRDEPLSKGSRAFEANGALGREAARGPAKV